MKTNNKKRIVALSFLLSFFTLLTIINVLAADTGYYGGGDVPSWMHWMITAFGLSPDSGFNIVIVCLAVFFIFFFGFADILSNFSGFGGFASWMIGLALAIIATFTRGCVLVAHWLMTMTVWAGSLGIFVAILMSIAAFVGLHFGVMSISRWVIRRQMMIKVAKNVNKATNVSRVSTAFMTGITNQLREDAGGQNV